MSLQDEYEAVASEVPEWIPSRHLWETVDDYFLALTRLNVDRNTKRIKRADKDWLVASVDEAVAVRNSKQGEFWSECIAGEQAGNWAKTRQLASGRSLILPEYVRWNWLDMIFYVGAQLDTLPEGTVVKVEDTRKYKCSIVLLVPGWEPVHLSEGAFGYRAKAEGGRWIALPKQLITPERLDHYVCNARFIALLQNADKTHPELCWDNRGDAIIDPPKHVGEEFTASMMEYSLRFNFVRETDGWKLVRGGDQMPDHIFHHWLRFLFGASAHIDATEKFLCEAYGSSRIAGMRRG